MSTSGTSGGVWGLDRGYCMMIAATRHRRPPRSDFFRACARPRNVPRTAKRDGRDPRAEQGYIHAGRTAPATSSRWWHNGIEYGLMQAYAEGFDILKNAGNKTLPEDSRFDLDLTDIAEVWRRGSVISSWLLDLTASALAADDNSKVLEGVVEDSGEGRWTIMAAIEEAVPADRAVGGAPIPASARGQSHTFAEKILSAMPQGFWRSRRAEAKQS